MKVFQGSSPVVELLRFEIGFEKFFDALIHVRKHIVPLVVLDNRPAVTLRLG